MDPLNVPQAGRDRSYWMGTVAIWVVATLLRIWLIQGGGQFGQIDEARYLVSRDAARLISQGKGREGIALSLAGGDHVGFKLIGIAPALLERWLGQNDHTPAYFFGGFSLLNIILVGAIAKRICGDEGARFWTTLVAAGCGSWFYFARHLLPYDASMSMMLVCMYIGFSSRGRAWSACLAGLAAGAGFVIYYGYWMLAGAVLAIPVLWRAFPLSGVRIKSAVVWGVFASAGFVVAILFPIAIDASWGGGELVSGARRLSGTIVAGDFRGHLVPWEYLWYTDRMILPLAIIAIMWRAIDFVRTMGRRNPNRMHGLGEGFLGIPADILLLAGVFAIYVGFILTGNVLHKFAIHDRLIRELTPFLILILGIQIHGGLSRLRGAAVRRWGIVFGILVVAVNAAVAFAVPLSLEFPRDFKTRGDVLLAEREKLPHPGSYYRYVNVTHYFREPEALKVEPMETLLVARHPHQYIPYLFEAHTPEQRSRRLSVDHRMRLVRMPVVAAEQVTGDPYGNVTMHVRFAGNRGGFSEPLLSVGVRGAGDIFFVRYLTSTRIIIGVEVLNLAVFESEPIDIEIGKDYSISLFSGSLMPPAQSPLPVATTAEQWAALRSWIEIGFDGKSVLRRRAPSTQVEPENVYAGVNVVGADSADSQFAGLIHDVVRSGWPTPEIKSSPGGWGQIKMSLVMPSASDGGAEPLVVSGETGKAAFVYLRSFPNRTVKLGIEVWGLGAWETDALPSLSPAEDSLTCSLPTCFPPAADPSWSSIPNNIREKLNSTAIIAWNGKTVLVHTFESWHITARDFFIGENPVGGSVVRGNFTGKIRNIKRLPFTTADMIIP